MLKNLCLAAVLALPFIATAQQASVEPPPAAEAASAPGLAPSPEVIALVKDDVQGAARYSDFCHLEARRDLPSGAIVVVVRKVLCTSRYGATLNKTFLEVLYGGKKVLVSPGDVAMTDESVRTVDAREPAEVNASAEAWEHASVVATNMQLKKSLAAVNATAKSGIAIFRASAFDVSEYTEGTGFSVTVYNSGRKTIKYVTFSVVGLNAVNDPVRDTLRSTSTPMLRGIGPIAPGESASYRKEYMWMTDVVQTFRISQIKLEFTDGTNKVLTDLKSLRISDKDVAMLTADMD